MATIGVVEGILKLTDSFTGPLKKISAEIEKSQRDILKSGEALSKAYSRLAADLDPAVARQQDFRQSQIVLEEALKKGIITQREYNVQLDAAKKKFLDTAKAVEPLGDRLKNLGGQMTSLGTQLSTTITLPIVAIGGAAVKLAMDFEQSFTRIETLVGLSGETVQGFRDDVLALAGETARSPKELAEGLYFLTSAGLSAEESLDALVFSARAAALGLGETGAVANAVSSVVNAYGQEVINAERATNVLALAVRAGKLEAAELAPVMGRIIPMASAMKVQFEDVVGVMAAMSRTGLNAAESAVSLNAFLSLLAKGGTKETIDILGQVGLSMGQLRDMIQQPGGLVEAMRLLNERTSALSEEALAKAIPEIRALRGVMNIMAQDAASVDQVMADVASGVDVVGQGMKRLSEDAGFKFQKFLADSKVKLIELGAELLPALQEALDVGSKLLGFAGGAIKVFSGLPGPAKLFTVAIFGITAAAGPLLFISGQLITAWGTLIAHAPRLAAAFKLLVSPVSLVTVGVVALGVALNELINRWRDANQLAIDQMVSQSNKVAGATKSLRDALREGVVKESDLQKATSLSKELGDQIAGVRDRISEANAKLGGLTADSWARQRDAIAGMDKELRGLTQQKDSLDAFIGRVEDLPIALEESADGAATVPPPINQITEALRDALKAMSDTTAADRALLAALEDSQEAYEILNTLLNAGIPLRDALTGAYDKEAKAMLAATAALAKELELRQQEIDLSTKILDLYEKIGNARESASFGTIERPDLGEMVWPEVEADQWKEMEESYKATVSEMSLATEAMMKRAFENVQDAAGEAIFNIFDDLIDTGNSAVDELLKSFLKMLSQLLVMWMVNVAKRLAAELRAAAASAAAWKAAGASGGGGGGGGWMQALAGLFGGGGGGVGVTGVSTATPFGIAMPTAGATPNAGLMAGGALGALAIVGVTAAFAYWAHTEAAKKAAKRWFGVAEVREGWSAIFGSAEVVDFTSQFRDKIREIFIAINGVMSSLPEVTVDVRATGKEFRSFVEGQLVGIFKTYEEAFAAAALKAIEQSDLSRMIPEVAEALRSGAIKSVEQLAAVADVFARIGQVTDPVGQQVRQFLSEIEVMTQTLIDAGIAASALAEYTAAGWQAIRDQITGATKSAQELFAERSEAFNRARDAEEARLKAIVASSDAAVAAAQVEIARTQAMIASLQALQSLTDKQLQVLASLLGSLATAEAALASASAAAAAAQAALDALPKPIAPGEFKGGGGGKGTAKADAERVADAIANLTRALLPDLARALADVNVKYDELIIAARKDAEAIAALNALREQELLLIRQQAAEDFYSQLRDFEVSSIRGDVFAPLAELGAVRDQLAKDFLELADALGFAQERIDTVLDRIASAYERQVARLSKQVHIELLGGLANLIQDEKLRNRLLLEMERLKFVLEWKQLQAQFALLQAMGLLTRKQIKLIERGLAWINVNADKIINSRIPVPDAGDGGGGGAGGGAADAARELADALNRLKEIQARQLSPFMQAIRGVVDEFADLRRVLGWTTQLQELYAIELKRVIDAQLESIQRMRDDLTFRSDSPAKSIDQFNLAQQRANEAMAALTAGDLSQLDAIPDLLARVLELNPRAQASEGSRFLFAWVDQMLAEAQEAALTAAEGIEPGGANDPFAWLRVTPTAGDDQVVAAIDRVAFETREQTAEEKAEAAREAEREKKRAEREAAKAERVAAREQREKDRAEARVEKIIQKIGNANEKLHLIEKNTRGITDLAKAS